MEAGTQNEACLFLNVYTPAADSAHRPVMVWIHGGGFTGGSGSQALYEGASLTCRGDIVLVTINYRLGVLGYLDLNDYAEALEGVASNLGQRDQIAALQWVRDNIEAFGGNPNQVTIFGESAGGMAVSTLIAMPQAKGLFQRVIAQSGATQAVLDRQAAARILETVLGELDIAPEKIEKLRKVSTKDLLQAQLRTSQRLARDVFLCYAPVIDGDSLPEAPLDFIRAGGAKDIPLIVGANLDEWKLFSAMNPKHFELDEVSLKKAVASRLRGIEGADAERMIAIYRAERPDAAPCDLLDAIESDRLFRVPAIRMAEAQSRHQAATYEYLFTWPSPARRGKLGACHAIELPFVFGTFDAPTMDRFSGTGPAADALSAAMMDAWISFARNGDPNCAALPTWSGYTDKEKSTMIFDRNLELRVAPNDIERAAWDNLVV
jgi:para-nitrobenzyl esterase